MNLDIYFEPRVDLRAFRKMLDTCGHPARARALLSLGRDRLAALFDAAAESEPISLEHFVPSGLEPLHEVIHHGRNTLPLFTHFQKRFCRPDGEGGSTAGGGTAAGGALWGYNEGTTRPFTGPGYFVAREYGKGEVLIDYGALPPHKVPTWPTIMPNKARLGRFVWVHMTDVVRGVSEHASIGRAFRKGEAMDAWFVLCREDPQPA